MDWETLGDGTEAARSEPFAIADDVRRQHMYLLGRTGSGKSTLLARLALSDIARGDGGLVLDPHGDLVQDILTHCPADQLHRIIYLDSADREYPVPFNMFECGADQNRDTICSEVIGIFKRLYGDSWGPLLEDLLRSLTLAMLDHQFLGKDKTDDGRPIPPEHRYNATLKEAHNFLFSQPMRTEFYDYITNEMVLRYWTDFYDHLGSLPRGAEVSREQIRHNSSTTNKLRRFLLNPLIFDITSNSTRENPIDLRRVMNDKQFLLVNLSKGRLGEENSALLGSLILSRLVVAALSRAEMPVAQRQALPFHVIVDEFQAFATESFKLLLSEARKYALTVTIAHQHREQLDKEMRGATLNCGSMICFRVTGADAADVSREFDSTPRQRGWRFEPLMLNQDSLSRPEDDGGLDAMRSELESLFAREKGLIDELGRFRLNGYFTDAALEEPWTEKNRELAEVRRHIDEWSTKLEGVVERQLQRVSGEQLLVEENGAGPAPSMQFARSDVFIRVPDHLSYAETDRAIANALTQLPNYNALARLANGDHRQFRSRALPATGEDRQGRVDDLLDRTHQEYAVAPDDRRSVQEAETLRRLRRQEAEVYEAELNEQPP